MPPGIVDDISDYQALCCTRNAMKRDTDDADLRAVRASYEVRDSECAFRSLDGREVVLENPLAVVIRDKFPVSMGHLLVVPRRHVADHFDLGSAESRACDRLLREARKLIGSATPGT
jgi:hypothetical protein